MVPGGRIPRDPNLSVTLQPQPPATAAPAVVTTSPTVRAFRDLFFRAITAKGNNFLGYLTGDTWPFPTGANAKIVNGKGSDFPDSYPDEPSGDAYPQLYCGASVIWIGVDCDLGPGDYLYADVQSTIENGIDLGYEGDIVVLNPNDNVNGFTGTRAAFGEKTVVVFLPNSGATGTDAGDHINYSTVEIVQVQIHVVNDEALTDENFGPPLAFALFSCG
jgi:hypothetical protein